MIADSRALEVPCIVCSTSLNGLKDADTTNRCCEGIQDRIEVSETLHWYFPIEHLGGVPIWFDSAVVQEQNELALQVLERAALYQEALEKSRDQLSPQETLIQARLSTEYFVLRTIQVSVLTYRGLPRLD